MKHLFPDPIVADKPAEAGKSKGKKSKSKRATKEADPGASAAGPDFQEAQSDSSWGRLAPTASAAAAVPGIEMASQMVVAAGPGLLERIRRFIQFHHLHHQIVQRYKEHPDSLQALVGGLLQAPVGGSEKREVFDAEYEYLAKFLEHDLDERPMDGHYQPDFPLLILFGFADRLACRGPDNVTTVSRTARIDLAVLAFWACYPIIQAQYQKRKRKKEQPSRVFKRLSDGLRTRCEKNEQDWAKPGEEILGKLRRWYNAEKQAARPLKREVRSSSS